VELPALLVPLLPASIIFPVVVLPLPRFVPILVALPLPPRVTVVEALPVPPLVPIVELLLVTLVLLDALPVFLLISGVPLTPESPKFLPTVEVATLVVFRFTPSTTGLRCFPSVLRSVFTIELVIVSCEFVLSFALSVDVALLPDIILANGSTSGLANRSLTSRLTERRNEYKRRYLI
jgi:hypothetical protein